MALGPRLDLRQSQSLVMTPQLQQAIKLLALSSIEIDAFIADAMEKNPLLEVEGSAEDQPGRNEEPTDPASSEGDTNAADDGVDRLMDDVPSRAETVPLDIDPLVADQEHGESSPAYTGDIPISGGSGEAMPIEDHGSGPASLGQHLMAQLGAVASDAAIRHVAEYLIGLLDEAGYLTADLRHVANELDLPLAIVEEALDVVQTLDPTGVGARNLAECLRLQAIEADRHDPCMAALLDNLDLLAKGNLKQLKRICDVDDEDFVDMLAELRSYDPKPGLQFSAGQSAGAPIVPDVLVRARSDDGWDITLNQATLPRLCVNRDYFVELKSACDDKSSRAWLNDKLTDANWLIRALDQRQKTILKVATEVVKQQEGFFRHGVSALKPLTLREVAEAIEMHESTVSRVTANKYLHCERGTLELKYFFTSGVASADGEGAVSAEAVKAQIRALIDAEDPKAILSDDALVDLLRDKGFDLARRTVAKYREAIGIGSSVQRRRQKALAAIA
ncbi:MAG: RNA polymerase factor sigma-54 [Novosphingobium sp.]